MLFFSSITLYFYGFIDSLILHYEQLVPIDEKRDNLYCF